MDKYLYRMIDKDLFEQLKKEFVSVADLRKVVGDEKPLGRGVDDMTDEEVRDCYQRLYDGLENLLKRRG